MKEWILENTEVTEEEYDRFINLDTVTINGESNQAQSEFIRHPMYYINLFTLDGDSFITRFKYQVKKTHIKKVKLYEHNNIQFYILSQFLKKIKYTLSSTIRLNQCFHLNFPICLMLKNQSYLITALCDSPYHKNKKFLHTFILVITDNNQEYIVDGTSNTIMKKETYYSIYNPEVISCISKEELKEDKQFIEPLENKKLLYKGEYYCFRDKVLKRAKQLKIQ